MFWAWAFLVMTAAIWLVAVFYIIKGWEESKDRDVKEIAIEGVKEKIKLIPEVSLPKLEVLKPPLEQNIIEEEIEIPIGELHPEEVRPPTHIDWEDFYREFGKANIVEFPAEYIDRDNVRGLSGNKIGILEFAKKCYREIDFQCIDAVMVKEERDRVYRVNIFDLVSDHYASTEENFVDFFGQLKKELAREIEAISTHPDITLATRKALVGRYEALPQLVVWNNSELLLVMVKSKYDTLSKKEADFFKEFVIDKKLFKAKIFKVTQKKEQREEIKPFQTKIETDKEKRLAAEIFGKALEGAKEEIKKASKKPFTEEEIKYLMENKDKFTNEELAIKLGRSLDSVTHKLSRLHIARESYEWTEEKDDFLRNNITTLSYRELAEKLGTTMPSVRARCKKISIRK